FLSDMMSPETAGECRKELEKRADLTLYTTPIAMDDLDEVREALGYERINLFGGSYGSRAALVYLRQHPTRVRSVVLMGAVPTYFDMPFSYSRSAEAAMDRLVSDCAGDKSCGEAFPNLRSEFQSVLERLAKGPVKVTLQNPATGRPEEVELSYAVAVERIRFLLYSSATSRQLPLLFHKAAQGDFAPLAREAASTGEALSRLIYTGMFFSVTCAEDVPFIDQKKIPQEIANTFLRDVRLRTQITACQAWPRASLPAGYRDPVRSDAPVLILSGAVDPVTPAQWGDEVGRYLPNSLHVVNPNGGHSDFGACSAGLIGDFIKAASVKGLDPSCIKQQRRQSFVIQ
ncbi:MAG TPA: alpha/beta fold hydrolase, partial [Blastocatellia bacterium]|nr:alpha/beta fold hydrolase [Blastocatellia bacterium]